MASVSGVKKSVFNCLPVSQKPEHITGYPARHRAQLECFEAGTTAHSTSLECLTDVGPPDSCEQRPAKVISDLQASRGDVSRAGTGRSARGRLPLPP